MMSPNCRIKPIGEKDYKIYKIKIVTKLFAKSFLDLFSFFLSYFSDKYFFSIYAAFRYSKIFNLLILDHFYILLHKFR